ncbi:MAG: AAA family ATPase [Halothiobacillaceae bacterium]
MNETNEQPQQTLARILDEIGRVVLGKPEAIRSSLACLLAGGHLLLEDVPGVGKTTLAHALARAVGLRFRRLQFTADMMPADVLGVTVYEGAEKGFRFHPGPVFTEVLLADEINRAPAKVQSALLEAMEEQQVSVDGKRYPLPEVFFVIATQNPVQQLGTYPLPESQLDRFSMVIELGYPPPTAERAMLKGEGGRTRIEDIHPVTDAAGVRRLQATLDQVHISDRLVDYVQALLAASRERGEFLHGLSPRAGLVLLRVARAWAMTQGRNHVEPEDVQAVFPGLVDHRLVRREPEGDLPSAILLRSVPVD